MKREKGQTIVIAMIVLGVLLILGFVFLGILNQNIGNARRAQTRSEASDLSEAGIRYAHSQLLETGQGADWRPAPTTIIPVNGSPNLTRDPDIYYLRPGTGYGFRTDADPQKDLGGPDGLGPFVRVPFTNGRALIRVRYGPSDANVFSSSPTGPMRNPSAARNLIIIESIGRQGAINPGDPTTLGFNQGIQFQGFGNGASMRGALAAMKQGDASIPHSRRLIAFASLDDIQYARFIANKYHQSKPAEIGVPKELGAMLGGVSVGPSLAYQVGTNVRFANQGLTNTPEGFGSIHSNADLMIHGTVMAYLNRALGDQIDVAGSITGDNDAHLEVFQSDFNRNSGTWVYPNLNSPDFNLVGDPTAAATFNSRSDNFSTAAGNLRDGESSTDSSGFARGVGYIPAGSIESTDPNTGLNRYVSLTRESGRLINGVNAGRYGHGAGIYVDNFSDIQIGTDEASRARVGTEQTLVYDWLNPNNGKASSGWIGPFYTPRGAILMLQSDGMTVYRDSRAPAGERLWLNPDGTASNSAVIRYKFGSVGGQTYVIDSLEPGVNFDSPNPNFAAGQPFNGVMYLEGNVRVRGVIPTDVQLSVVSNGTVYIDGSITKGVQGNYVTDPSGATLGQRLSRPSRSALWLAAREYVALNTSQFFGPSPTSPVTPVNDVPQGSIYNPVRVPAAAGLLSLQNEFVLDSDAPGGQPYNPQSWRPFAAEYVDSVSTSTKLATSLFLTQAMDNGPAPGTFIGMDANYDGTGTSTYYFPKSSSNSATVFFDNTPAWSGQNYVPIYGLGAENWQRFARMESSAFTLIDPNVATFDNAAPWQIHANGFDGSLNQYILNQTGTNEFRIHTTALGNEATNDFLLARAAVIPNDVRIEAAVFAEEGSFFVIPAPWLNNNPNDRRDVYDNAVKGYVAQGLTQLQAQQRANADRLDSFGTYPQIPFFGEPPDMRVTIVGSVAENMPPPSSQQAEWIRKWGWIPRSLGSSGSNIPLQHVPASANSGLPFVPNLIVSYDPVLATGRTMGFARTGSNTDSPYVRSVWYDYNGDGVQQDWEIQPLPPLPRLPVSPALSYFGEVQ